MFDLPFHSESWLPAAIILAAWLLLLLGSGRMMQRRLEARFQKHLEDANTSLSETRQFQRDANARAEDAKVRAAESLVRQQRMGEIAEQSMLDRQEMLSLLRRIAERLESRDR